MDQHSHPASLGHYSAPEGIPKHRLLPSRSSLSLQATIRHITDQGPVHTSKTWTTSSGEHGILSDTDELEDRASFVQEYNRLAKKVRCTLEGCDLANGSRTEFPLTAFEGKGICSPRKQGWLYRILRSSSNQPPSGVKPTTHHGPRHKRSVSDLAHSLVHHRRETPKILDLQSMVRISGKSVFYLPAEHAPSALILPTCLRATAHHIAQYVTTRGIFRIPGSIRVVNMLFDYYCCTEHGHVDITSTVRCANLPMHVQASVHDVASTFKRLLSVIPGGILGSLSLFDALVAVHSQLQGDPEFPRTKQTKVRARLIALAVATVKSQFRRELICAVFGLLSLIGRVAEITPREDEEGRPLPTGDLMGYNALGIVFGPLLLGDLLGFYSMKLATPKSGLLVLPLRSPKLRQDRHRRKTLENEIPGPPTVDKILIANSITEMLIVNWRDVVRQMKSLGMNRRHETRPLSPQNDPKENINSDDFVIKKPQGWDREWRAGQREDEITRESSPEPGTPTLGISRQRSRNRGSSTSKKLGIRPSIGLLSPTVEESIPNEESFHDARSQMRYSNPSERSSQIQRHMQDAESLKGPHDEGLPGDTDDLPKAEHILHSRLIDSIAPTPTPVARTRNAIYRDSPRVSQEDVPPRTSSKQGTRTTPLQRASIEDPASQNTSITPAKEATSIGRKGAIRKKHVGKDKLQKTPHPSIAVNWLEPVNRSSEISTADMSDSQPTHLEFLSEKEALEAALKAHFDELKELDSSDQYRDSLGTNTKQKSHIPTHDIESELPSQRPLDVSVEEPTQNGEYIISRSAVERKKRSPTHELLTSNSASTTPRQFYAPMRVPPCVPGENVSMGLPSPKSHVGTSRTDQSRGIDTQTFEGLGRSFLHQQDVKNPERLHSSRVISLPVETPKAEPLRGTSTPWFSIPKRKPRALTRPSLSPTKPGGVKAMAAKFETGEKSTETSPTQPRSASRTQTLISHFSQPSLVRTVHSTRSVSTLGRHSLRKDSISSQNPLHSRNLSAGANSLGRDVAEQDLRASIREEAAMRAVELRYDDNERKQLQSSQDRPQMLAQRQTIPPRKPVPGEKGAEASLQNPLSLGKMMPYPEQPPIAQHLNLVRPPSSTANMQYEDPLSIPHSIPTPIPRPGSTTTLHAQIRSLQRQLDLKTEEMVHLRRQLEVQEDADVGTLSQQLREAKREARTWRERAESAERRIKVFERFTARLKGIREATAIADQNDVSQGDKRQENRKGRTESDEHKGDAFLESAAGYGSDSSGRTEDAGVVAARIRRCLHGLTDGPPDSSSLIISQIQDTEINDRRERNISQSAVEIWMAAQELLHLDEAQGQSNGDES
ncbi:hypothetical protein FSARC_2199 [Fusarium sarcochroum]|uniref:Rho-GAP domain-containing protein n=1 Tax=Fusarium sarcochroum TaxID=1208366 RepID=A0A8H4XD71_9HYPO|nr:hypothetical protein FSARC_2199 [Fusarium sarcochroum]